MTHSALVIGLGQIGMSYDLEADPQVRVATLARAFAEHGKFDLVGGVDSSSARRELFINHYARPAFSSVAAALEERTPAVVAIAVPTEVHYSVLLEVMQQVPGIKAILCEKPLSYDLAEATEIVELTERAGVRLYTNYMRRCDRAVIEVKRRIQHGEIAGPIKGVCWYSKGLFNNGSHFLNLFQFWLGDVSDFEIIDKGRLWLGHDPEPDLKVRFDLGEIYFHAAREENFSYHSVELVATNGRLRYESGSMSWQAAVADSNYAGYVVLNPADEAMESDAPRLQWFVADQIARDLAGEAASICTGAQGLSTIQILAEVRQKL
jgi:predicted dehydrogenase